MIWVTLTLGTVVWIELFVRLPLIGRVRAIAKLGAKATAVFSSRRISDHWKERVLLAYATRMARLSIVILFLLVASSLPTAALFTLAGATGLPVWETLISSAGLLVACGVGVVYTVLRFFVTNNEYTGH
ncbi:MAG: hypothetical protein CMK32_01810 [Porticoccaceae bacterium]|nr:hypothetical protein [Porticoccaceae bacterium]